MERLYFHSSVSVCVSVCVSVSVCMCVCLCVSVCVCVWVCVSTVFLWTKFQPNGCTNLDAVFTKWLLTALAQTLLKLVILTQRLKVTDVEVSAFSECFLLFIACVFIVKAIILIFSEDWDVGILYLSTKFELDWSTNNEDLSSDRNHWKRTQTYTHRNRIWYYIKNYPSLIFIYLSSFESITKVFSNSCSFLHFTNSIFQSFPILYCTKNPIIKVLIFNNLTCNCLLKGDQTSYLFYIGK